MTMKLSTRIRPISYLKAHAAEVIRDLNELQEPLVITQHGEAKAVMLDVKSYEQSQETLALLKLLALGNREVEQGKVQTAEEAFRRVRNRGSSDK